MTRSSALPLALLLATTLFAAPSRAQEDDSKTFFAAGRELRAAGRCEEAIVQFRRALDINPQGLGSLRNIAECEEQLGLLASARRSYWDLRRAVLQTNETKYQGWEKDAEDGYQRLAARVPKLTVRLSGRELERVRVNVDGKPLDPRLVGTELERDLGPHTVSANYGGAAPVTRRIELPEAARETLVLEIPDPTAAFPRPSALPGPREEGSPALRTAGIISLAVGGAALVGTVVSLVVRAGAKSDLEDLCLDYEDSDTCATADRPAVESAQSRGDTATLLVNVFGGVAIAGIGAGITLAILGSDGDGDTEVQPTNPSPAAPTRAARRAAPKRMWLGVSPTVGGAMIGSKVTF